MPRNFQILVASGQKGLMKERMKLLNMLWENDVNAEMLYKANPKLLTQFQYAETESKDQGVSSAVVITRMILIQW